MRRQPAADPDRPPSRRLPGCVIPERSKAATAGQSPGKGPEPLPPAANSPKAHPLLKDRRCKGTKRQRHKDAKTQRHKDTKSPPPLAFWYTRAADAMMGSATHTRAAIFASTWGFRVEGCLEGARTQHVPRARLGPARCRGGRSSAAGRQAPGAAARRRGPRGSKFQNAHRCRGQALQGVGRPVGVESFDRV